MPGEDDYCELCDLPKVQCVHGMPKPVVEPERPRPMRAARAPRESTSRVKTSAAAVSTRTMPRKWTPPADFVPQILAILQDAGGSLPADDALARVEERMADHFRPGDHEKTPQGELRWRTAARKARRELVQAGVLNADQPGVWRLSD